MDLSKFSYEIPESLIAYEPTLERERCRLLSVNRQSGNIRHQTFTDIVDLLKPEDLLVLNNTKVLPARLIGNYKGRDFEVMLLEEVSAQCWKCLVKPGKKIKKEGTILFPNNVLGKVERFGDDFTVTFDLSKPDFEKFVQSSGKMPLPPYIKRRANEGDLAKYQTVYAKTQGSVAAPTAGLHFSKALLDDIRKKGTQVGELTLHIGYGTFSPIRAQDIEEHQMHSERYEVSSSLIDQIHQTRVEGGRVIAVGTTVVRALESLPSKGPTGRTDLFIKPGFEFKNVDGLITNFHLPRSSLLVLVSAFLGIPKTQMAYQAAISEGYRFFSYGDAMAIL